MKAPSADRSQDVTTAAKGLRRATKRRNYSEREWAVAKTALVIGLAVPIVGGLSERAGILPKGRTLQLIGSSFKWFGLASGLLQLSDALLSGLEALPESLLGDYDEEEEEED